MEMSNELAKVYDPRAVENEAYEKWQKHNSFAAAANDPRESFCMVIPPPNVTAALHLGHALNNTLQDVIIRFKRMSGFATLWMPGTDHAGIATQTVVEKRVLAEEGKRRTDFKREDFVAKIQAWKDEYEATILSQLKLMGCSCDWARTRFTMDSVCAKAVRETFSRLFSDGLIYRGKRLVNWDPATQTVLADDEVEHEDIAGFFWYLKYPLEKPAEINGKKITHVTVATTRPETMLGDTAVAMNPADPRAKVLAGTMIRLPIVGRLIPIILDDHVVLPDPESSDEKARFSTGFLKVTPAHDPDDYQIGQRHSLAMINIMAPDGSISDRHGWDDCNTEEAKNLLGMDRFEAREAIVEWFRNENLLEKVLDYTHSVGHSYRSHVPIEPYLSDQWYVAVKKPIENFKLRIANCKSEERDGVKYIPDTDVPLNSLAGLALQPLLDGRLKFTPARYANNYQAWLENLRDWPISRQLWWGHQIPVWSKAGEHPNRCKYGTTCQVFQTDNGPVTFLCVKPGFDELEKAIESEGWQRDADVLDTWFSSALWPFSTLKWPSDDPADKALLEKFYPGNVLSTAREIITLWVSRMVMMGQYCAGDIPFSEVFIHAMIQDGQGRKMSKSLGNGVNPLDIIDSHGADAMRYTLVSMTTQTQDVRMPIEKMTLPDGREVNSSPKFDIGRNLCNKLWNASRFAIMNLSDAPQWSDTDTSANLADRWILSRMTSVVMDAADAIEKYRFNDLAEKLYHFLWDDFCDWYLEVAKARINAGEAAPKAVTAYVLDTILRLMHPIMPFITEAIWANLNAVVPSRGPAGIAPEMLITAPWPTADESLVDADSESAFATLADAVRQIRNARQQHNVAPKERVNIIIESAGENDVLQSNIELLEKLAGLGEATVTKQIATPPAGSAAISIGGRKIFVLDIIDTAAELERLGKLRATLEKGIAGVTAKLGNANFISRAPAEVVENEKQRLAEMQANLSTIVESINAMK